MSQTHLGFGRSIELVLLGLQAQADLCYLRNVLGRDALSNLNVSWNGGLHWQQRLHLSRCCCGHAAAAAVVAAAAADAAAAASKVCCTSCGRAALKAIETDSPNLPARFRCH